LTSIRSFILFCGGAAVLALMTSVYTALHSGMSCAVSRAWPDRDPIMPSLSFRLKSWARLPDGSAVATVAVQIRAINPALCDDLGEDADTVMQTLGFALSAAADDVEPDTGFPLKLLEFSAVLGGAAVAPLSLSILKSGSYASINGLSDFKVDPAEALLIPADKVSSVNASFTIGRTRKERITASGLWIPADVGQLAVRTGFLAGASQWFTFARSPLSSVFLAFIDSFVALPSGFSFSLQVV